MKPLFTLMPTNIRRRVLMMGLGGVITAATVFGWDCAGEWTRCMALLNDGRQMVVRNAQNPQDGDRRARKCRPDVNTTTYFHEGVRLACAPYLICDTN